MGRTRRRVVSLCIAASLSLTIAGPASGASLTDAQRADNAIGYLARQQAADGSMPGFSAIGSTADAELAVRAANIGADVEHGAITFLRKQVRAGNVTQIGAVAKLHFPGLHQDAAKWLAETRKAKAVGLDTASIDYGQSTLYESHRVLYERDIPAFENLTNLDQLPARGAIVIALPMKIKGGSGAPLRAIAILR